MLRGGSMSCAGYGLWEVVRCAPARPRRVYSAVPQDAGMNASSARARCGRGHRRPSAIPGGEVVEPRQGRYEEETKRTGNIEELSRHQRVASGTYRGIYAKHLAQRAREDFAQHAVAAKSCSRDAPVAIRGRCVCAIRKGTRCSAAFTMLCVTVRQMSRRVRNMRQRPRYEVNGAKDGSGALARLRQLKCAAAMAYFSEYAKYAVQGGEAQGIEARD